LAIGYWRTAFRVARSASSGLEAAEHSAQAVRAIDERSVFKQVEIDREQEQVEQLIG